MFGSGLVQVCFKFGSDLVQAWLNFGSTLVQFWFRCGSTLDSTLGQLISVGSTSMSSFGGVPQPVLGGCRLGAHGGWGGEGATGVGVLSGGGVRG